MAWPSSFPISAVVAPGFEHSIAGPQPVGMTGRDHLTVMQVHSAR
jgi:hypothetical protein